MQRPAAGVGLRELQHASAPRTLPVYICVLASALCNQATQSLPRDQRLPPPAATTTTSSARSANDLDAPAAQYALPTFPCVAPMRNAMPMGHRRVANLTREWKKHQVPGPWALPAALRLEQRNACSPSSPSIFIERAAASHRRPRPGHSDSALAGPRPALRQPLSPPSTFSQATLTQPLGPLLAGSNPHCSCSAYLVTGNRGHWICPFASGPFVEARDHPPTSHTERNWCGLRGILA
jgi:hypothetical protein